MIRKLVRQLRTRAKEIAAALKSWFRTATPDGVPDVPTGRMVAALIVPDDSENALSTGKRFRLTGDHAPIFSLFTFFGLRPQ
jgi:hypothetical protein